MALDTMCGFQTRVHPTSETEFGVDGFSAGAILTETETTIRLNGDACVRCPATAASSSYRAKTLTAPAAGTTLYACAAFRVSALPNATKKIIAFGTASLISGRLNADGTVALYNDVAGTQIGSQSQLVVEVDRWYFCELGVRIGTGATDYAGLRVFGDDYPALSMSPELVAESNNFSLSDTQPVQCSVGWIDAPGVTSTMYLASLVIHNSTGTKLKTWPGHGYVELLLPAATFWTIGSWTTCTASTTIANLVDALNNVPATGHADTTSHTDQHQVRTIDTLALGPSPENLTSKGYTGHLYNSTASTSTTVGQLSTIQRRAIGLTLTGALDSVQLVLAKVAAPTDDLIVELWDTVGGLPNASVASLGTINGTALTTTATWYTFDFNLVHLSAPGTRPPAKYWVVIRRSGATDGTNYYRVYGASATYHDGASAWNGTTWGTPLTSTKYALRIKNRYPTSRVRALQPFVVHGKAITTGTDPGSLSFRLLTGVAAKTFNFADAAGVAAGTFPTGWRTVVGNAAEELETANMGLAFHAELSIAKTGSGSRVCLVCAAGVYARVTEQTSGWNRWQKTSDLTYWWTKFAPSDMVLYQADGETEVTVTTGDYALAAESAGEIDMSTLTTITETALFAEYVQA